MKKAIFITLLFTFSQLYGENTYQRNATAPSRTPEQEASYQTQRITEDLNLSQEQSNAVYDLNLKHARERQISNTRSDALERFRRKDAEMQKILTPDQYSKLQERRTYCNPQKYGYPNFGDERRQGPNMQRRTAPGNRGGQGYNQQSNGRRQAAPAQRVQPTYRRGAGNQAGFNRGYNNQQNVRQQGPQPQQPRFNEQRTQPQRQPQRQQPANR